MYRSFLLLLTIGVLAACGHTPQDQKTLLAQAGRVLPSRPDSALRLLRTMRGYKKFARADRAQYALLLSEALDKCGIPVESDSLISMAVDYFEGRDTDRAGLACFYLARCERNRGNTRGQTSALFQAAHYAGAVHNLHLLALVNGEMARNYEDQQQWDSAAMYYRRAAGYFRYDRDTRNQIVGLYRTAYMFYLENAREKALRILAVAESLSAPVADKSLITSVYRLQGLCYAYQKQYGKALRCLRQSLALHDEFDYAKHLNIAYIFAELNRLDSARYHIRLCHDPKDIAPDYYTVLQEIAVREGDLHQALYFAQRVNQTRDSLYQRSLQESFAGLQKRYHYESLSNDNRRLVIANSRKERYLFGASCLVLVLLTGFLFYFLHKKRKELQQAGEKLLLQEERDKVRASLKEKIDAFRQKALLSFAPVPYGHEAPPKCTREQVDDALHNIDACYNRLRQRLKDRASGLTDRELDIALLALEGFTSVQIAELLGMTEKSVNVHRSNFRKKMKMEGAINWHDFLAVF